MHMLNSSSDPNSIVNFSICGRVLCGRLPPTTLRIYIVLLLFVELCLYLFFSLTQSLTMYLNIFHCVCVCVFDVACNEFC